MNIRTIIKSKELNIFAIILLFGSLTKRSFFFYVSLEPRQRTPSPHHPPLAGDIRPEEVSRLGKYRFQRSSGSGGWEPRMCGGPMVRMPFSGNQQRIFLGFNSLLVQTWVWDTLSEQPSGGILTIVCTAIFHPIDPWTAWIASLESLERDLRDRFALIWRITY